MKMGLKHILLLVTFFSIIQLGSSKRGQKIIRPKIEIKTEVKDFSTLRPNNQEEIKKFHLIIKNVTNTNDIPITFSDKGENINPRLEWGGNLEKTETYALIMQTKANDSSKYITHWFVWDIPSDKTFIPQNLSKNFDFSYGLQGVNDFNVTGYTGPIHDSQRRSYIFKLYALSVSLNMSSNTSFEVVLKELKKHIVEYTETIAHFGENKPKYNDSKLDNATKSSDSKHHSTKHISIKEDNSYIVEDDDSIKNIDKNLKQTNLSSNVTLKEEGSIKLNMTDHVDSLKDNLTSKNSRESEKKNEDL